MSYTTSEELTDINTYILLPMLLDMIGKWMSWPEFTPLKHLQKEQFQQLLDMITLDHVEVKQKLKAANIKVVQAWRPGSSLDYKIYVRRYEEAHMLWKGWVKAEISVLLGKYVAKLDKSKFKPIAADPVEEKKLNVDRKLFVNFD